MNKKIEHSRYDKTYSNQLEKAEKFINLDGSDAIPLPLRKPYLYYEALIKRHVDKNSVVLDVCCGNGIHTMRAAKLAGSVVATDISEYSLKLAELRAQKAQLCNIKFVQADAEALPFENESFDVIICAGSLSYFNITVFLEQANKLLKNHGKLIIIDSFDVNPIYRMNRFIHFIRGNRSYSTLKRMPNSKTITLINNYFSKTEVKYFGIFSFLHKPLLTLLPEIKVAKLLDTMDTHFSFIKKMAFKIVLQAEKRGE